jgi:hypothetical protein
MTDAWSEYSDIHINTVPVPARTELPGGAVVYSWQVEAAEELGQDDLMVLRNLEFPASLGAVSIDVLDSRLFRLSQVGQRDSELLSSGPVAARVIDERVAPLWLIDDTPHIWYPVFMDQIRDRIRSLTAADRIRWTCFGLFRIEPLIAAVSAYEMSGEDLLPLIFEPSWEPEIGASLSRMEAALRRVSDNGLVGSLIQAVKAALTGMQSGSVNKLADSREQVFDALYAADARLGRHRVAMAKAEDRARMRDVLALSTAASCSHEEVVVSAQQDRAELQAALNV